MSGERRAPPWPAVAAAFLSFCFPGAALAQSASPAPSADPQPIATRVLAVGSLTAKATSTVLPAVLEREVPATLRLYLAGSIDDWYARTDQAGVVFILNVTTVAQAKALLDPLPLGQAGMMTFEYTPLGPLRPLGMLLRRTAK